MMCGRTRGHDRDARAAVINLGLYMFMFILSISLFIGGAAAGQSKVRNRNKYPKHPGAFKKNVCSFSTTKKATVNYQMCIQQTKRKASGGGDSTDGASSNSTDSGTSFLEERERLLVKIPSRPHQEAQDDGDNPPQFVSLLAVKESEQFWPFGGGDDDKNETTTGNETNITTRTPSPSPSPSPAVKQDGSQPVNDTLQKLETCKCMLSFCDQLGQSCMEENVAVNMTYAKYLSNAAVEMGCDPCGAAQIQVHIWNALVLWTVFMITYVRN